MMSAEMATLGLLKIKLFKNKGYYIIILSLTSPTKFYHVKNYIVDVIR